MAVRDSSIRPELSSKLAEIEHMIMQDAVQRKPRDQPSFASIALVKEFRADKAIPIIAVADPSYVGIAEVLFLGLCGWVVSPNDDVIELALMHHGVIDHMAAAEQQAGLHTSFQVRSDLFARYILVGPDFLSDVYYEMSGHFGFSSVPDRITIGEWLSSEARALRTLVKACQIMHYATDHLDDPSKYHRLSLTRIIEVLSAMRDDSLVERTIFYQIWGTNKRTLSLLYAASTISRGHDTLLDRILSGEVRSKEFQPEFDLWVGRAKYFATHVLSNLRIAGLVATNMKGLKSCKEKAFLSPDFSPKEAQFLERKMSKKQ
ncbi:hypothetical protein ACIQUB_07915 [Rhizobium sp. NPDC090275]|uniref:hypothetical protein n=1 Tax=Rhizobium sp. NPDC090275 TaxID=3364498 RepID=UPI00383A11F5